MNVLKGSTDVTTYFHLRLAASGLDATGLTISDVDMQYTRNRTAPTAKVDAVALAATDTAHTDNRGIEIDATDQPGLYRFDWPDAAFATGVDKVLLTIKVATAFTETLQVDLVDYNPQDGVRLGLTALPNAAAEAAGGLYTRGTGAGQLSQSANGELGIATLAKTLTTYTDNTPQTGDVFPLASTEIADIKAKTDLIPAAPASTTNITAGTITNVTNLTNAPTNGDFTATMKAATLARVALVDTLTAYTNNTPQTGDSFARIGVAGAGLTAVDDATLTAIAALWTTALTESYAADGVAPTPAQLLFRIAQNICEFVIAGTTITVKKLDKVATAETYTLDDATTPTSRTRAT